MKCIIVDDETKSRILLKKLCEEYGKDLSVAGMAASVTEAIEVINAQKPQLVFLDIRLPKQSGFALLEHYGDQLPFSVIFTSAYDNYAFQAFKYTAVDYLQKPIEVDELVRSIEKVRKIYLKDHSSEADECTRLNNQSDRISKVALTTIDGYTFVKFENIVRCEAQGNYTSVFLTDGNPLLITKTLKHYEELLLPKGFFRVHKSHLINLHCVRKFIKGKKSMVEMIDGMQIEVSFRRRDALLDRLAEMG